MIKIKRKNYIKERAKENLDYLIKSCGYFLSFRNEDKWRGKNTDTQNKYLNSTEDRYQLKQILKRYQKCKDEQKGYSSKYLLRLTDLLDKKDKDFSKKRLELYFNRTKSKEILLNNQGKYDKGRPFKTICNIRPKIERIFKPNKIQSSTLYNSSMFKKNKFNNKYFLSHNHSKTLNNFFGPLIKDKSIKYFSSKSEDKMNFFKINNKFDESTILSQPNLNEVNILDESLKGKEKFLETRDKENYKEYLKNEYRFFIDPDTKFIKFSYAKSQRIKKFKNLPNRKYLKLRKNLSVQNNFINKIKRNDNKNFNTLKLSKKNNIISNKIKINEIQKKINKNINFINDCRKIFFRLKNDLS